jgi:ubiquinone/menaquinone biosynthesis C-methylase UbiE
MGAWFEDESFWSEMYPFMFPEERFRLAEEQIEKALALVGYKEGTVLDLCCGPGRHSLALAKRGIQVTAVDRSEFLLHKAKEETIGKKISGHNFYRVRGWIVAHPAS